MASLTDQDKALLAVHTQTWQFPGAFESAVFAATGLRSTAAWQRVNALIDTEAALAHDPILVKRLRRIRASRIRTRSA